MTVDFDLLRGESSPVPPYRIGLLPGEGIGPSLIDGCRTLLKLIEQRTGTAFEIVTGGDIGIPALRASGTELTPEVVEFCASVFDAGGAVLCGPGGGRFVYALREQFDLYCKLAPIRPCPALADTGVLRREALADVDILVVRENIGGLYQGQYALEEQDGVRRAVHQFAYREDHVARIIDTAAAIARRRSGRLCVVLKPGGAPTVSGLWSEQALRHAADVELRLLEIDNACYQVIADARRFDVIVAPNMFGDVLADGAALLLGSRGMSYSANFSGRGDAVFQTGHGAAHDLAGKDEANPIGQMLALAMMLRQGFRLNELADELEQAIDSTLASGWRTADLMAPGCQCVGTRAMFDHVAAALDASLSGRLANRAANTGSVR